MSLKALYLTIFTLLAVYFYRKYKYKKNNSIDQQIEFIKSYPFPSRIYTTLQKNHPYLIEEDIDTIVKGLRDYFYICAKAKGKKVSMPSQAVGEAWYEFALFNKLYESFCIKAFGKFLDHHPAEAMNTKTTVQKEIQRVWKIACQEENISYLTPLKLPFLFNIDTLLNIENGFKYGINCKKNSSNKDQNGEILYCASNIMKKETYKHTQKYLPKNLKNTDLNKID